MIALTATNNDSGQRLDRFLLKNISWLNRSLIFKYLRTNKVKVNKKKEAWDYRLFVGDEVILFVNEISQNETNLFFQKTKDDLKVVFEDGNILIINKPAGLISHEDEKEKIHTLKNKIKLYLYNKKEWDPEIENTFEPSLCNRLDRNTSGLIIAAKNIKALRSMNELIHNNNIEKYYLALVHGFLPKNSDTLLHYHYKNAKENIVYICEYRKKLYSEMITKYKVIDTNSKYSIVEIQLITGKTHQIRAHFNFIGNPLVGEKKYINKRIDQDSRYKFQKLFSYKIKFKTIPIDSFLYYLDKKEIILKQIPFSL